MVRAFTGSALEQPRLAWALGYEPVDPLVDAERLAYRQTYRERLADLLRIGIEAGEMPEQDADLTAASLIGAISEALVGPLSPVAGARVSNQATIEATVGLLPARRRRLSAGCNVFFVDSASSALRRVFDPGAAPGARGRRP